MAGVNSKTLGCPSQFMHGNEKVITREYFLDFCETCQLLLLPIHFELLGFLLIEM